MWKSEFQILPTVWAPKAVIQKGSLSYFVVKVMKKALISENWSVPSVFFQLVQVEGY